MAQRLPGPAGDDHPACAAAASPTLEQLGLVPPGRSSHHLGLKEDDRVRVTNGRQKQALSISGPAGDDHLDPRHVAEEGLRALAVVVAAVPHCACSSGLII